MTIYHMINWFFTFSFFGYLLECAVLTFENKTPVIDRGFGHGPFCVIYGFGALGAYFFLSPFADRPLLLYFVSMLMATSMELITATVMICMFGAFWWDYSAKPFNYKGIICLESSIAWGFLGIIFFKFLDEFVHRLVSYVPSGFEKRIAIGLTIFYLFDFVFCLKQRLSGDDDDDTSTVGRLKVY